MYVRNPCEPLPTTTTTTSTTSTTTTIYNATPEMIENGTALVIRANNQFSIDLYSELKGEEGNIFFSPYSISTALAMLYEGARGQTADEIQEVFHFPIEDEVRRNSYSELIEKLNNENVPYKLSNANALWVQKNYPILKEYIETVEKYYFGRATNLDFVGAAEESRQTINTWVEDQTNNKIKGLFPPGTINELTRFVLTNAIYFKGNWVKQFDKDLTREMEFKVSPEKTVLVPMMTHPEDSFNYGRTEDLEILEMLYEGEEFSMLILLPKNDDLSSIEESFTLEKLNILRKSLHNSHTMVVMPKFNLETKYFLQKKLPNMGMPSVFIPNVADLSGIDGTKDLFVEIVVHQAFVDVNEEGTEAAAATGVGIGVTSMPSVFLVDHPFIFIIQERETGNILFMGRVSDPN
jgi:serpin B